MYKIYKMYKKIGKCVENVKLSVIGKFIKRITN